MQMHMMGCSLRILEPARRLKGQEQALRFVASPLHLHPCMKSRPIPFLS